jgi:hypothetical protein
MRLAMYAKLKTSGQYVGARFSNNKTSHPVDKLTTHNNEADTVSSAEVFFKLWGDGKCTD